MPWKPKKPCKNRDCVELVESHETYCARHKRNEARRYEKYYRPQTSREKKKAYNSEKWKKLRNEILSANPFCVECGERATEIDHLAAVEVDHPLFFARGNLRAMCKPCHSRKTANLNTPKRGIRYRRGNE